MKRAIIRRDSAVLSFIFIIFLSQVTVLPPGEWDPSIRLDPRLYNHFKPRRIAVEPRLEVPIEHLDRLSEGNEASDSEKSHLLSTSCRFFNGILQDLNVWRSRKRDYKDGVSMKCFGTSIFIYLLLLAIIATIGEHEVASSGGLIVSTQETFFMRPLNV